MTIGWQVDRSFSTVQVETSFPEQAIFFYLRKVTSAQNRYRFKGEEIVIFLGDKEWNTAIEYDGAYYHSTLKSHNREKKKNQLLAENGIRLIRIKEGDYDKVSNGIIYVINPEFFTNLLKSGV